MEITQEPINTSVLPHTTDISLWELLIQGSLVGNGILLILLILFIIALAIFFERYWVIQKASKHDTRFIHHINDFISEGKITSALDLSRRSNKPQARMIEKGIERMNNPPDIIAKSIEDVAQIEVFKLEKNLSILANISSTAPMLGFLGTVIGLIMVFFDITQLQNYQPKDLASGLYTAMTTTAVGLIVGIIANLGYNILIARVEKSIFNLQQTALGFMDLLYKKESSPL